jgi:phosphoglycerate dehydrogenase-like enzyme
MSKVVVTSPSFSNNLTLRAELESYFPCVKYNETGKNLEPELIPDFVGDAKGLILGLEKAGSSLFNYCKNLKVISKYGVGLNNIDIDAAQAASVMVLHTPGVNRRSVAELTLAFMIGISRNIFNSIASVKEGSWVKNGGFEISGKNIGIVGFGNIGKDLACLLKPFGVNIYANDVINFIENTDDYAVNRVSLERLLEVSDVISLHVPYTKNTHHLISSPEFDLMKKDAIIINTSRGGIIDETALLEAVLNKGIKAALDVFEVEPQLGTKLVSHPHIFPTPHIGGNSREAVLAMGRSAIENLRLGFRLEKI